MKIVAIIQARMSSSRLPNKVLLPILGKPMLQHLLERVSLCSALDEIVVATSENHEDSAIELLCSELGFNCHRGSLDDVLDRFYRAAEKIEADVVVRLTGDCPLLDPEIIDKVVSQHTLDGNEYTSNVEVESYPDGLDVEVFSFDLLQRAWQEAKKKSEREHVTPYIRSLHGIQKGVVVSDIDYSGMRWTVDEESDFRFVSEVFARLGEDGSHFGSAEVIELLSQSPELGQINCNITRNEGYLRSLEQD